MTKLSAFLGFVRRQRETDEVETALDRTRTAIFKRLATLPPSYRRSLERAFYSMHLRELLAENLLPNADREDSTDNIVADFATVIQALLRKAHGKDTCEHHEKSFKSLTSRDAVISFNYDLVAERALRPLAEGRKLRFGRWLCGLEVPKDKTDFPRLMKLHGSSNWRLLADWKRQISVRTTKWADLDAAPGYQGHKGWGTEFPISLPLWDKRIERRPWLQL